MAGLTADRRLWLTADGKVVEDGDPAAAVLLAAPGGLIPAERAKELGLTEKGGKVVLKAKEKPADKAKKKPSNK